MSLQEDNRDHLKATLRRFIRPGQGEFQLLESTVAKLPIGISRAGQAFLHNLHGAISMVSMPYMLAITSARQHRFHQLRMASVLEVRAEMLESGCDLDAELSPQQENLARERAGERFSAEVQSTDGRDNLLYSACGLLDGALQAKEFCSAADELMQQGVVLAWGSMEALARDLLICLVNSKRDLFLQLRDNPVTRRAFNLNHIDFETLEAYEFNLSDKLGDLIVHRSDFNSLHLIKDTYTCLFPGEGFVREQLSDARLWMLAQKRHVLVHNRGVADKRYLSATGDSTKEGEVVRVGRDELLGYFSITSDAGRVLLEAASVVTHQS